MTFFISTLITIIINGLGSTAVLGGLDTKALSDIYFSAITPAGFTFGIWSLIYIGLLALGVMILTKKITLPTTTLQRYIVSCVLNSFRILIRQYQYLTLSLIVLWLLLWSLLMCYHTIKKDTQRYALAIKNVFLLYIWRVLVASLLIATIYLTHTAGTWFTDHTILYAIIALSAGATLNTLFLWWEKTQVTTLVFLWALYGIYNGQTDETIQTTTMIIWLIMIVQLAFFLGHRLATKWLRS